MQLETTPLADGLILTPHRHDDARGWFCEGWHKAHFAKAGLDIRFVQDNRSHSITRGTLRGLHCQVPPRAQAKLVRCSHGAILDVAVDIREGSPSKGRWFAVELSAENRRQHYVPAGFLHGFVTLSDGAEVDYKCSDYYSPAHQRVVRWDDPALGIDWPVRQPILSDRDRTAPLLAEVHLSFRRGGRA